MGCARGSRGRILGHLQRSRRWALQLQQRRFSALGEGEEYLSPTLTRATRRCSALPRAPLAEQLRLQFGARVEHAEVDGTPASDIATSRGFTPVSASAGLVFDGSDSVANGLSLSSAARAPAQTELFARGVHEATATYETGLPSLPLERANSARGQPALAWRARACRRRRVGHRLQPLHLWRTDRAQLQ